jgi:hypothetical protein
MTLHNVAIAAKEERIMIPRTPTHDDIRKKFAYTQPDEHFCPSLAELQDANWKDLRSLFLTWSILSVSHMAQATLAQNNKRHGNAAPWEKKHESVDAPPFVEETGSDDCEFWQVQCLDMLTHSLLMCGRPLDAQVYGQRALQLAAKVKTRGGEVDELNERMATIMTAIDRIREQVDIDEADPSNWRLVCSPAAKDTNWVALARLYPKS